MGRSLGELVEAVRQRASDWIAPGEDAHRHGRVDAVQSLSSSDVTSLRSLSPKFEDNEHDGYVRLLVAELSKAEGDAPLNLALTGHYGSGKSSVLVETERRLKADNVRVINLSLPSLGVGDGRIPQDGDPARDRTNLIQKEIVKQLLYRRKPGATPASRYNRLDDFDRWSARRRGAAVGGIAALVALLFGLPRQVSNSLPEQFWDGLNTRVWSSAGVWVQWLSLLVVFGSVLALTAWAQRMLQQKLRVTELGASAGPASVKLSEPTASYFDEYLDEIVYYFQTSKTTVVIFEDLDRFKDPHIFETLRELNLLLNHAEQTGEQPIKFVYAIRDSIFEQLDSVPVRASEELEGANGQSNEIKAREEDKTESRRLMTTNRTKFFDLVVPMVPFISHRTSRDLMLSELESVPEAQRPRREVVELIGRHITDMRLIKNICNEFDLFRTRILREGGLKELTADNLFASIVYKNLFLLDYEKVRHGTSLLDDTYDAYRSWVKQHTASARARERRYRQELRQIDGISTRSTRLGARLQDVLLASISMNQPISLRAGGDQFSWDEVKTAKFWRAFLRDSGKLQVTYSRQNHYTQVNSVVSFDDVETLMNEDLSSDAWDNRDREGLEESMRQASAAQLRFSLSSLADAMNAVSDEFEYRGESVSLKVVAQGLFDGAPVVVDLMCAGYIDENFTLYVTQFPGGSSASAMNFIIKAVQPNVMDIDFHFGAGEEVNENDIRAALEVEGPRILSGFSVYNREIFDFLLATDAVKLHDPIRRLGSRAEEDTEFIDAYVASGLHVFKFLELLSGSWAGIFKYLMTPDSHSFDLLHLDAAVAGVASSVAYEVNDAQRDALTHALTTLPIVRGQLTVERAEEIAKSLVRMGVTLPSLQDVGTPLVDELVARHAYEISIENLRLIVGDSESVSLDSIGDHGHVGVYNHLLENLGDYLRAIESDPHDFSVADADRFAVIIHDVSEVDRQHVETVARLAHADCMIATDDDVAPSVWPQILRAGRLTLTVSAVTAYIGAHDLDETLTATLEAAESVGPAVEHAENVKFAQMLLNETDISRLSRLRLVASLSLESASIDPVDITIAADDVIPELVRSGAVADDAAAFNAIGGESWQVKYELMRVSGQFASYLPTLSLSSNDIIVISRAGTPDEVKRSLLDCLDSVAANMEQTGATALTQWAARAGYDASPEQIATLVAKAKVEARPAAIKLLGAHAATIDASLLKAILNSLGGNFAQLTTPGWTQPTVPDSEGMRPILDRLTRLGIVSSYKPDRRGLKVHRRRK